MDKKQRASAFLITLQHADSFFPGGAMAFSWGLEALHRERIVHDAATLISFVQAQVLHRWATADQGLLSAACGVAAQAEPSVRLAQLMDIDALADAISLVPSQREGSCRLGRTMVSVHAKLDNPGAAELQPLIDAKRTPGHLAVMQGYLWTAAGMNEFECRAAAAHLACSGAVSAAVRLSCIGHLDAQRAIHALHHCLAVVLEAPAPALDELSSCTFAIDIAAMRHPQLDARLFAN